MSSDDHALLRDIVLSARRAIGYVSGIEEAQFEGDVKTQDAVLYREAARWLSDETCASIDVDWPAIVGMRHRLVHGYRNVRLDVVWRTVVNDLPILVVKIERSFP